MSQSSLVFAPSVTVVDGKPTTLSTDLARHFGKQHRNVLQAIENLLAHLDEHHALNFQQTVETRQNPSGGAPISTPAYRLTRDGFTLLAMGFTGKKALAFKLAYIDAFNRMEAELQQQPAQDVQRLQLAQTLATQAGAQVMQAVFDAVMSDSNADWRRARYLLSFGYDQSGQPSLPLTKTVTDGQIVANLPELAQHIATGDIFPSDTQLAALASACTNRLNERAQIREQRAAQAAVPAPAANAVSPTTAVTSTTRLPPHIGLDGKPLPPGTFRAVFV